MPATTFADILKFNPYHDARGRFTTANSATLFTIRTQDPDKQYLANEGIRREKERDAAEAAAAARNTPQMQAIRDIEDQIRNQDMESAACVDKDGNVLFFKDGEKSKVEFTRIEKEMAEGNVLTHNHPSSSMFSPEDVDFWVGNGIHEIRATNRLGITYCLQQGDGFTKEKGEHFSVYFQFGRQNASRAAQLDLDNRGFRQKLRNGEMTEEQADAEFRKVMAKELSEYCTSIAPHFGINFYVEQREVGKSAGTVYTAKSSDDSEIVFTLDKEGEKFIDDAFKEWLAGAMKENPTRKGDTINPFDVTTKSNNSKSILFIGLQIGNAEPLAIDGGENHEDFHVTLAYGHFEPRGDEDDTAVRVQHAIDDIRDLIPDTIHFDATGRFSASKSSDGKDVIYAQVAAGQLEKAHDGLLAALKKQGIKLESTFPEYKPHMTLAYIDQGQEYELHELDATGTATKVMIGYGEESSHENEYTVMKTDDEKRLVFGWASISFTADGEQLEDLQHDIINPEDLEEAVYEYVLNFRDTGEEHRPHLRKKGKLVESCVFTLEKQKAMGLPEGILPVGWWIGFKIEDDEAWEKVRNGTYRMFSIEGKANRVPVEKSAPAITEDHPDRFDFIEDVEKFNPYHDSRGRFTNAGAAMTMTYAPGKSRAHDLAIQRAKERMSNIMPTDAQDSVLKGIERKTRNLKKEQFRVVDREGNVVFQKQGDAHSVTYTVGEAREHFDGNITIHNHPSGGTFSPPDLSDIGYGATEIRAAAPEGTYVLRNLAKYGGKWNSEQKGWNDMRDDIEAAKDGFKSEIALRREIRKPFDAQLQPLVDKWTQLRNNGAPVEEQQKVAKEYTDKMEAMRPQIKAAAWSAYLDQYHHWYKENAGKYGMEYEFIPVKTRTKKSMEAGEDMSSVEKRGGDIVLDAVFDQDVEDITNAIMEEMMNQITTTMKGE